MMSRADRLITKYVKEIRSGLEIGAVTHSLKYNLLGWLPIISFKEVFS